MIQEQMNDNYGSMTRMNITNTLKKCVYHISFQGYLVNTTASFTIVDDMSCLTKRH